MKAFIALCFLAVVAAEPWGYSRGGWGRRSYGGWSRGYGSRGYAGRGWGKREAEADPQVLLNSGLSTIYPSTIYSGINTYPTTYTSGLFNTGLFNTGLYSTGLTHIVKRDADAEAYGYGYRSYGGWGRRSYGGRWGGYGRRGYWKREAEAEPQILLNSGLRTVYPSTIYSGINTFPMTYSTGLFNTGLFNTGLTHIVKREAEANGYRSYGWNNGNAGRWGGWNRGYYGWGNRGYSGWGRSYGRRWGYSRW